MLTPLERAVLDYLKIRSFSLDQEQGKNAIRASEYYGSVTILTYVLIRAHEQEKRLEVAAAVEKLVAEKSSTAASRFILEGLLKSLQVLVCAVLIAFSISSTKAQTQPIATSTPATELKLTLLRTDVFALGNNRSAPLITPEIGGFARVGKLKVSFFSFVDLTPRQTRTWNININSQTVSWTTLRVVRLMVEEARTTHWAARAGPGIDVNQLPGAKKVSGKVFKSLTMAWFKGLVNEPSSQLKVSYATKQWHWKGDWQSIGFFRFRFGNPDVFQPGLNYTRKGWHGVALRMEYNQDRFGKRWNFGPSLDLLRLFR
jgi:hypothetical protein